ncbi:hypothetical protein SDC9_110299 [bioreactor metagenome]|uniref:Uncharacterized protein n=1 Tax=bioreactor metagenome TaxID=1076179 RepID=A0A645BD60_9ZZZZ
MPIRRLQDKTAARVSDRQVPGKLLQHRYAELHEPVQLHHLQRVIHAANQPPHAVVSHNTPLGIDQHQFCTGGDLLSCKRGIERSQQDIRPDHTTATCRLDGNGGADLTVGEEHIWRGDDTARRAKGSTKPGPLARVVGCGIVGALIAAQHHQPGIQMHEPAATSTRVMIDALNQIATSRWCIEQGSLVRRALQTADEKEVAVRKAHID